MRFNNKWDWDKIMLGIKHKIIDQESAETINLNKKSLEWTKNVRKINK